MISPSTTNLDIRFVVLGYFPSSTRTFPIQYKVVIFRDGGSSIYIYILMDN